MTRARSLVVFPLLAALAPAQAWADDRLDSTLTLFSERRGESGSLQVVHPQVDLGIDLGAVTSMNVGYEADIVSGATPSVYAAPAPGQSMDAVTAASEFSDTRHAGHGGLAFQGKRSSLALAYTYGTERDYRSHAVSAGGSVDLPGKNTTFALSYTRNFDRVCDFDNGNAGPYERRALTGENVCFTSGTMDDTVTHKVDLDSVQASMTQNLSPIAVLQLGIYGQVIRGFQSNPYRRVRVAGFDAQESLPLLRVRSALFARLNLAVPSMHAAFGFLARGYADTWGVKSAAIEGDWSQYLGSSILFRVRGRVYQQTEAVFFEDALDYQTLGAPGAFFTGDRELSPFRTYLAGGKLSYLATGQEGRSVLGLFDDLDFHLKAEGIWSQPLVDHPPGADASGPLPDAVVLQLALLLHY